METVYVNKINKSGPNVVSDLRESGTRAKLLEAVAHSLKPESGTVLALASQLPEVEALGPSEYFTLQEWLEEQGLDLSRSDKHALALIVGNAYLAQEGRKPRTISRQDSKGRWNIKASGFRPSDRPLLKRALKLLKSKQEE